MKPWCVIRMCSIAVHPTFGEKRYFCTSSDTEVQNERHWQQNQPVLIYPLKVAIARSPRLVKTTPPAVVVEFRTQHCQGLRRECSCTKGRNFAQLRFTDT